MSSAPKLPVRWKLSTYKNAPRDNGPKETRPLGLTEKILLFYFYFLRINREDQLHIHYPEIHVPQATTELPSP